MAYLSRLIIVLWAAMALLGPWLPLTPDQIHLDKILQGPSAEAWLGYDDLGRPVFDRLVMGAATSFFAAAGVVSISVLLGCLLGALAAWRQGWFDHLLTRVIDVFLAFPGILLAIALAGILGPGLGNVIIALAMVGWVGFARLLRAQALSLKHRDHVLAAQALGTSQTKTITRHILPLAMAPILVEASFAVAAVIVAEAGLSFLGLGVQAPQASWGGMIRDGTAYLLIAPHLVLAPGVALLLVVLAVNQLGDEWRDRWDVRRRGLTE